MSQLKLPPTEQGKGWKVYALWLTSGLLAGKPIESVVDWLIVHFLNTLLQTGWPISAEIFFKWGLV